MKWINASEKVPGYLKKGLSKMSDYVAIHFYSDYDGRIITSTARYCHDRNKWFDIMHNSENNNEVNPIEWLDESTSPTPDWTKEKTYDSEGTVDKEAIAQDNEMQHPNYYPKSTLKEREVILESIMQKTGAILFNSARDTALEAMDEYAASVKGKMQKLSEENLAAYDKLWNEISSNEAKEKECEYWKQLVQEILLEMEWGNKKLSLEQRIVALFNKRPEITLGINVEAKALGLQLKQSLTPNQ